MDSNIELSNKRVSDSRKRIARALGLIEASAQEMKWACEAEGWNEDVTFQIDEAATKLGFALATLTRWEDEDEEEKTEE